MAVLLSGLNAALVPLVSTALPGRASFGTWGAVLFIILPAIKIMPAWEAWSASAALMGFCVVCHTRRGVLLRGAGIALLALLNPLSAIVALSLLLLITLRDRPIRSALAHVAVVAALGFAACTPWMLRNAARGGSFSLKNNFGMTLLASNNECAQPSMAGSLQTGCYQVYHPAGSPTELATLQRVREGEYDRYTTSRALSWIRGHLTAFIELTARRAIEFWFPPPSYHVYAYSVWGISALSLMGVCLVRRRQCLFLLGALVLYSAPYYIVVSDVRYRYPVLWVSFLLAGVAIEHLYGRFRCELQRWA